MATDFKAKETMKPKLSERKLDVSEFARCSGHFSGELSLADMPRLKALCMLPSAGEHGVTMPQIQWQARGQSQLQRVGDPQVWLYLEVKTRLPLRCERCLKPVEESFALSLSYRFVPTEEQAAIEDEESVEDVLALTQTLDLHALCEDELILALPLVAVHERCPDPLVPGMDSAEVMLEVSDDGMLSQEDVSAGEKPHPFAALEAFKKKLH